MKGEDFYSYSSLVYYEGAIYYFTEIGGKLLRLDIVTNELSIVYDMGDKDIQLPYRKLALNGDVLFLIPFYMKSLIMIDLKSEKIRTVNLPAEIIEKTGDKPRFFGAYCDENSIYMFGFNQIVIQYDINKEKFYIFNEGKQKKDFTTWFRRSCCKINDCIYIPFFEYPNVLTITNNGCEVVEIGSAEVQPFSFSEILMYRDSICYVRENEHGKVWVDLFDGDLTKAPYKTYEFEIHDNVNRSKGEVPFLAGCIDDDMLIMFPGYGNVFGFLDLISGTIRLLPIEDRELRYGIKTDGRKFFDVIKIGKICASLFYRTNALFIVEKGSINQHLFQLSKRDKREYFRTNGIIYEEEGIAELGDFVNMLSK